MTAGTFTISLDFELYWGMRDVISLNAFRQNLQQTRNAIPQILQMFAQYGVHATWATVGFLFYTDRTHLLNDLPSVLPYYSNKKLNPYPYLASIGQDEKEDPYHFAPSLIRKIAQTPGQEVASHTLSHYYCLEAGQTADSFEADLATAIRVASAMDIPLRSLVFPRNQCNPDYLGICHRLGIIAYRGPQAGWMYTAMPGRPAFPVKRLARLVDAYVPISAAKIDVMAPMTLPPVNVAANRFLRPFNSTLAILEPLRLKRILEEMTHAARNRQLYHLWFHPHNFGCDTVRNLQFLGHILQHFRLLQQHFAMQSLNMQEIAIAQVAPQTLSTPPVIATNSAGPLYG